MSMSRVVIDGTEVEVPTGSGLVEAAASTGIEIPVFCYEKRIGPAVGACRMCLVEIEGMPKLQTACSTPVRDGMVVSTVSDRAREAQEAVLEFLLINHPLDCPVCDKGGECPLQDQAFRWGPGASRFMEVKRNSDKPIEISPLITLDRERCILCYRCTRFSDEVTDDQQLIARNRGADSQIATFAGKPYADRFSGNIVELCPVGALTSTEYRFKGRPWEAPDHATACGLCPVGCNSYATVREGKVIRVLSRENEAVDNGWLCDRGRFSYSALYNTARRLVPMELPHRERPAGNRLPVDVSVEGACAWFADRVNSGTPVQFVVSGSETLEEIWGMQQIAGATGGRVVAVHGGVSPGPAAANSATLADVSTAGLMVLIGDEDLADTAPIVDLRVRAAVRAGARLVVMSAGATRLEPIAHQHVPVAPGSVNAMIQDYIAAHGNGSSPDDAVVPTVIICADGTLNAENSAAMVTAHGLDQAGSGFLVIPGSANGRGVALAGVSEAGLDDITSFAGGTIFFNVDPAQQWPDAAWRPAIKALPWVASFSVWDSALTGVADLHVPAQSPWEKEGTIVSLEGRLQRLSPTAPAPGEIRSELWWLNQIGAALGVNLPVHAGGAYRAAAQQWQGLPATQYSEIGDQGALGATAQQREAVQPASGVESGSWGSDSGTTTLFVAPFLYDNADSQHADRMEFLSENRYVTLSTADAEKLKVHRGDSVTVSGNGWSSTASVAVSRRLSDGVARIWAGTPGLPGWARGYGKVEIAVAGQSAVVKDSDVPVGAVADSGSGSAGDAS